MPDSPRPRLTPSPTGSAPLRPPLAPVDTLRRTPVCCGELAAPVPAGTRLCTLSCCAAACCAALACIAGVCREPARAAVSCSRSAGATARCACWAVVACGEPARSCSRCSARRDGLGPPCVPAPTGETAAPVCRLTAGEECCGWTLDGRGVMVRCCCAAVACCCCCCCSSRCMYM